MIINLSPQVRNDTLKVSKSDDILTINGTKYDFSVIPDGADLPSSAIDCEFVIGNVSRINTELNITLLLPLTSDAPYEARFPQPIVNPPNGIVKLPTDEVA